MNTKYNPQHYREMNTKYSPQHYREMYKAKTGKDYPFNDEWLNHLIKLVVFERLYAPELLWEMKYNPGPIEMRVNP